MPSQSGVLDTVFQALSHPARRDVVRRLSRGPAAVSELAEPYEMALPSFLQHLQVLEASGLVASQKTGRVRTYRLTPKPLRAAQRWIEEQRAIWEQRLDQLDEYLRQLHDQEQE